MRNLLDNTKAVSVLLSKSSQVGRNINTLEDYKVLKKGDKVLRGEDKVLKREDKVLKEENKVLKEENKVLRGEVLC